MLFLIFLLKSSLSSTIMRVNVIFFGFLLAVTNGDVQNFISGNNRFMSDIYKQIKTSQTNILISPLSAEIILSLVRAGAKGETGEEIDAALHLPNDKEEIESTVQSILPSLQNDSSLHIANKIYVGENIPLKDEFRKVATEIYQSDIENIDFQQEQAADTINKWVEDHTNNKIHDLIASDDLDSQTVAILINALYFKGKWKKPFSSWYTRKQIFYETSQADVIQVDMMRFDEKYFDYFEDSNLNAKFLQLPFQQQNVSMVFVLPNEKDGISALENQINQVFSERHFNSEIVKVGIPKFRIESETNFKEILVNMGVKKAFDQNQADFGGMSSQKLWIDKVKQKTFIDVNEIGVEAAAATVEEALYDSDSKDPPKEFVADHPFIFYIKSGDLILFAGKLCAPNK